MNKNKNNDLFLAYSSAGLPENPVSMDAGVVDDHTVALFTGHEHRGEVIALSLFGRPRFNPQGGQRIKNLLIDETDEMSTFTQEQFKAVMANARNQFMTMAGIPRDLVNDELSKPQYLSVERFISAADQVQGSLAQSMTRAVYHFIQRCMLSTKKQPRKRRSGGRLVSSNERRARIANSR